MKNLIFFAVILLTGFGSFAQLNIGQASEKSSSILINGLIDDAINQKNDVVNINNTPITVIVNDNMLNGAIHVSATISHDVWTIFNILPSSVTPGGFTKLSNPRIKAWPFGPLGIQFVITFDTDAGEACYGHYAIANVFQSSAPITQLASGQLANPGDQTKNPALAIHRQTGMIYFTWTQNGDIMYNIWNTAGFYSASTMQNLTASAPIPGMHDMSNITIGRAATGQYQASIIYYTEMPYWIPVLPPVVNYVQLIGASQNWLNYSPDLFPSYTGIELSIINYPEIDGQQDIPGVGLQKFASIYSEWDGSNTGPTMKIWHSDYFAMGAPFDHMDDNPGGPYGQAYCFTPAVTWQGQDGLFSARCNFQPGAPLTVPGDGGIFGIMNPYISFPTNPTSNQDWEEVNEIISTLKSGHSAASFQENSTQLGFYTECWFGYDGQGNPTLFLKTRYNNQTAYKFENFQTENKKASGLFDLSGKRIDPQSIRRNMPYIKDGEITQRIE